jgi:hypothetical protein
MGVRINELTEAVQANGVDILELEQGAQSKKISIARAVGKIATAEAAASPYTVTNNDVNVDVQFTTGTVNLPAATGTGRNLRIIKTDSTGGTVTITPNGSDTIEGNSSVALYAQYDYIELLDIASGVWKVVDHKFAATTVTGSTYTVQPMDELIYVNVATATISLPAALGTTRKIVLVKTHATAGHITVSPNGTDTVEAFDDVGMYRQYEKLILVDYAAGKWAILNHGDFTPIPTSDRTSHTDSTVGDTWELADFSSDVRKGTAAVLVWATVYNGVGAKILLQLRAYGETTGQTDTKAHSLRLEATGANWIGSDKIVLAPNGKFEYVRYSSAFAIDTLTFFLWGYYL